ncbi:carbamoyltransferase HypF, partial [Candidatus Dojkabacteria bacterium]|nr:carbamoyltransferase HypF [Candidatus Dojkabacteria bacterium]
MIRANKYLIKGIVQGVGFRPFVYKLAMDYKLNGWVYNDSNGVTTEVEGEEDKIKKFIYDIENNHPPLASITSIELLSSKKSNGKYEEFSIRKSKTVDNREALIAADTNVCSDCLRELFDPKDRRYKYPFINCTNCGPRYSIIEDIPYDRPYTTMKYFPMCADCKKEYEDPLDRRFHAQPVACEKCGPKVWLTDKTGNEIKCDNAIQKAVGLLKDGKILAVKGLGGFHLMADPSNEKVVKELRRRKDRKGKPFALLSPSVESIKKFAIVNKHEHEILESIERSIVLLKKKESSAIAENVAPGLNEYGVMLPYTPLHFLMLKGNFDALIATSGNTSGDPIQYENKNALKSLSNTADYFLLHNRGIVIGIDDSIVRSITLGNDKKTYLIRRARGYTPKKVTLQGEYESGLAVGVELKDTVCLNRKNDFFVSQYIGDLKNLKIYDSFKKSIKHLKHILEANPKYIASDLHPNFYSSRFADEQKALPVFPVQHHYAHMASCMADNNINEKCIGVIFDGVGYGADGNMWGGEFLVGDYNDYKRYGYFDYFKLPGGDVAVKDIRRIGMSLLYEAFGESLFGQDLKVNKCLKEEEITVLSKMIEKGINSPLTSSLVRIFDGVAAIIGKRFEVDYEGQAAIELEHCIDKSIGLDNKYEYEINEDGEEAVVDIRKMIKGIVQDTLVGKDEGYISVLFHNTIIFIVAEVLVKMRKKYKVDKVVLSGGVFLNKYLVENTYDILTKNGFKVYTHSQVPTNDGGIS